jgi:hypothetical protein
VAGWVLLDRRQPGLLEAIYIHGTGQEQAGSASYRLRNATAQCVKQVHQLLGDPEVVGSEVEFHLNRYYKELDKQCNELWKKTKQWTGGQSYVQSARCVSDSRRSSDDVSCHGAPYEG